MRAALVAFPKLPWKRRLQAFLLQQHQQYPLKADAAKYSTHISSYTISLKETGNPQDIFDGQILPLKGHPLPRGEVLVKMLMATVNMSDLLIASGRYFLKPTLPIIAGNEGVGVIVGCGTDVQKFRVGDWVIPKDHSWGTWRQLAVSDCDSLVRVPEKIPVLNAATLQMCPCTAYRMLRGFCDLKPGDVVMQYGAHTPVGHAVIQLCREWDISTVNIITHRPTAEIKPISRYLRNMGADHVITDKFLRSEKMQYFAKALPAPPKLAIDFIGTDTSAEMDKFLEKNAIVVSYGEIYTPTLRKRMHISKEVKGYWQSTWEKDHGRIPNMTLEKIVKEIGDLMLEGRYTPPPCEVYTLDMYHLAIKFAEESEEPKRIVLKIDDELIL